MSFLIRVSPRRYAGGAIALLAGLAFLGGATVSLAEPADQAAATPTATATPQVLNCVSANQGIQVLLENPSPGASLAGGSNVVLSGVAYDPAATQGTGIDRVSAYLGSRESGGIFLGNAALGLPSPIAGAGSQFATAGFTLRSLTLPTGTGARTLFVYAHSTTSNSEGVVSVPVFLGAVPTPVKGQVPTPVLGAAPTCTPTPVPTVPSTPTPLPAPPTPTQVVVVPAVLATATPLPTVALPVLIPATSTPLASPAVAVAAPAPASVAATTAPRGGGIPVEVGFGLVALGAMVVGGGATLRRRQRGDGRREDDPGTAA